MKMGPRDFHLTLAHEVITVTQPRKIKPDSESNQKAKYKQYIYF